MNRPRAWRRVELPQENLQIAVNSQQSPHINSSLHRPVFISLGSLCVLCVLGPVKSFRCNRKRYDSKTPTSEGEVGVPRPVIQNHATVA